MEGSYGSGYGPLAYNAVYERSTSVGCGMKPVVIEMDPRTIDQQIKAAVDNYCIAFFVEIVRSQDERVLSPEQWRASLESCEKYDIVLIVDEAMTAVQCGAPFAHQLPEYRCQGRPDLVLFGKGIRTSGVAVD